jgi:hypothetical protein
MKNAQINVISFCKHYAIKLKDVEMIRSLNQMTVFHLKLQIFNAGSDQIPGKNPTFV